MRSINVASAAIMIVTLFIRYRYQYLERYSQLDLYSDGNYLDVWDYIGYLIEIVIIVSFCPQSSSLITQWISWEVAMNLKWILS